MALYNNGYPVTYQPTAMYYPQQYAQIPNQPAQQPQQSAINNSITWVQGEQAAKSYLVAPNTTVALWDSEAQTIYLKSTDMSGMPTIKTLDYTIRETQPTAQPVSAAINHVDMQGYAMKSDLEALNEQIDQIRAEVASLTAKRPAVKGKKEAEADA